jgi:parallel beta-helix repeat protein
MFLGDHPNSHVVELSANNYAFQGTASNITIKNLTIEKYAAPLQYAAVEPQGSGWVIQNNEVRLNHGWGVKAVTGGDNVRVLSNNVHDNGQAGIGSGGANSGLFDSNYIVHNNVDGVNPGFEGVGTKFTGNNLMISNNIVHDNLGAGLSTDANATYNTFNHNTSYNNQGCGIRYEISRYGTIENNTVYGNKPCGGQIVYTGSDHGRITGNTVTDGDNGGILVYNTVGTKPSGQIVYKVTDTQVTGNTILISNTSTNIASGLIDTAKPHQPSIFTDRTNIWAGNIYQVPGLPWTQKSWDWGENAGHPKPVNWSTWLLIHSVGELLQLKSDF